jgi:hypothetical protein
VTHQQVARGAHDALLLAYRDTGGGATVVAARAAADFGDDQLRVAPRDDVQFSGAAPVATRQDVEARSLQRSGRLVFRYSSDLLPIHGGRSAIRLSCAR